MISQRARAKKIFTIVILSMLQGFFLMFLLSKLNLPNGLTWVLFFVILIILILIETFVFNIGKIDEEVVEELKEKL